MPQCTGCQCAEGPWRRSLRASAVAGVPKPYRTELEKCRERSTSLSKKLRDSTKLGDSLNATNEELRAQLSEAVYRLGELEAHYNDVRERLEHAHGVNHSLYARAEQTSSELVSRLSNAEDVLRTNQTDYETLDSKYRLMEKLCGEMEANLRETQQDRENLSLKVASLDRQKLELQVNIANRAQQHQALLGDLEWKLNKSEKHREDAEARSSALQGRCRDLERQVALLSTQRAALEASLQTKCEFDSRRREVITNKLLATSLKDELDS